MVLHQYSLIFITSLGLAALLAPLASRLGHRLDIVDRPGGRRSHKGAVSRLGGVAVFVAFAAAIGLVAWRGVLTAGYHDNDLTRLSGLLIGGLGAFLFGLLDDKFELSPRLQFAFQFALSLVALATLLWLERFTLPFFGLVTLDAYLWGAWVYIPMTIIWVVGMINTVNWLDGLDGLAAGVGAILCLVLAIHMHRVGQSSVALLPLALLGALLGFLPFNFAPARLFLGSTGTFFLGYALGGLGLIAGGRTATLLMVMALPVVDVAWQIFDRVRRRRSPTQADRGHLHFRLLDLGLSQRTIVLLYWGICTVFGLLGLIASPWHKLLALVGIGVAAIVALAFLSRERET